MSQDRRQDRLDQASLDQAQLEALGYEETFNRSLNLWSNFALGFLYLSPLVGVISLFGLGLTSAGPTSIWWIAIVALGQLLVALVFGEVVSQYPIVGGIYAWARRLWGGRYAWIASWVYGSGLIIGVSSVSLFSSGFIASLFGFQNTAAATLVIASLVVVVSLVLNLTGTRALSRLAQIGLAAEITGVVAVGLYLIIFQRQQPLSVFFDTMGAGGGQGFVATFIAASLLGLYLFYGFEACGEVAEEVPNPSRRIPRAMQLTVIVGGLTAFLSFAGYVLAAPNLPAIISGQVDDPINAILESSLGVVGTKIFLIIALTSFLACVMSQHAAASRLIFSSARDNMLPGSRTLSRLSTRHVPMNALIGVAIPPVLIFVFVYFSPDSLARIVAWQILAGYLAFQMVVFAALIQRLRGWRPAGAWNMGRLGLFVNIAALVYGIFGMVLLASPDPDTSLPFYDRWISLIGFSVVLIIGLAYLVFWRPNTDSGAPEGDAIEIAEKIRDHAYSRQNNQDGAVGSRNAARSTTESD